MVTTTPENTSTTTTAVEPSAAAPATTDPVDAETYRQMLEILKDLTDHSHTFFDDYGTACQCNCNCNCTCCTRGMVW